jgi:DNA-binding NtrC family response regulator
MPANEPALNGHRILIVESDVQLQRSLQWALAQEGAETLVVADPSSVAGAQRLTQSIFTAAVVNDWHRRIESSLRNMPVLVYGGTAPVPAQADAIVRELEALLVK